MVRKSKRVALALGGGGARGLAHIGVLRVLEGASVPIDLLVGTSIGALVGGAYAAGLSADEMEARVEAYLESPGFQSSALKALGDARGGVELHLAEKVQIFFKNRYYALQAMFKPGILSAEDFQATINFFIPDIPFEETRIPFRAVATDLVRGEQITFDRGSLRQAVTASCAVPGAVEPLKDGEKLLLDGGVICLIPAAVARKEGADVVIAVAVDRDVCSEGDFPNALTVYSRIGDIMASRLKDYELMDADIVIRPEVGRLHWSEFSRAKHLIEAGERAAEMKLKEIQRAMPGRRKWFTVTQLLRKKNKEQQAEPASPRKGRDNGMHTIGRADIRPGSRVRVVQKHDQGSGKLTEGVVKDILTRSPAHPYGIKVRLESGVVGRVKHIIKGL